MDYTIKFTKTCTIAINYGIDGTMSVEEGQEYVADNIQKRKWAEQWVDAGLAEGIQKKKPKEVKAESESVTQENPLSKPSSDAPSVVEKKAKPTKKKAKK